jgi:hypothetical protein
VREMSENRTLLKNFEDMLLEELANSRYYALLFPRSFHLLLLECSLFCFFFVTTVA